MTAICRSCFEEIKGREPSAKLCFPCSRNENNRTGSHQAHYQVKKAIKKGLMPHASKLFCVDCAKPAFCYDHRDYNKPLDVEPVCRKCNYRRGSAIPKIKTEVTK